MIVFRSIDIDGSRTYRMRRPAIESVANNSRAATRAYETDILSLLIRIDQYASGRILLEEIDRAASRLGKRLAILPFAEPTAIGGVDFRPPAGQRRLSESEALFLAANVTAAGVPLRTGSGRIMTHERDNPLTPEVEVAGQQVMGRGTGGAAMVLFSPRRIRGNSAVHSNDATLFHELIHAKHALEGIIDHNPHLAGARFTSQEEFMAVVATDIYLSEKGALSLRGTHLLPGTSVGLTDPRLHRGVVRALAPFGIIDTEGLGQRDQPVPESRAFAVAYRDLLARFSVRDPRLAGRLGREVRRARFNPLRDSLTPRPSA